MNIHLWEGKMQTFLRESLVNQFVHLKQHIKIVFGFHSHPNGDINGTFTHLDKLNNSSVDITVRAWVNSADYWPVFFSMNEKVYKTFASEGLNIPFPQMDIHMRS